MNKKTYDISLVVGIGLTSAGLGASQGWPYGMAVAGALIIVLTLIGAAWSGTDK